MMIVSGGWRSYDSYYGWRMVTSIYTKYGYYDPKMATLAPLGTSRHQHRTSGLRMTQCKIDIGGHRRAVVEVQYQQ